MVPEVESISINDGTDSRSQIVWVDVNFNTVVDHAALQSAFTLTNILDGVADAIPVTSMVITPTDVDGKTTVRITFDAGASVVTRTGDGLLGNSLADGNYRLEILAAQVQSSAGTLTNDVVFGGQLAAEANNDDFFRQYGDADGNGSVNFLIPAFFLSEGQEGFEPLLDAQGDGNLNFTDVDDFFIPNFFAARP